MKKYDSLIFDLDGTLWDSSESVAEAWNIVLEQEKLPLRITGRDVLVHMGKPMDVIMRDLFSDGTLPKLDPMDFLKKLSVVENRHVAEKGGRLFPNLENTLRELKKDYRLFIVSNCQCGYIEAFLTAHKLCDYFEGFMCWGDTRLPKGETNKKLIEKYGLASPVYIGDTDGDRISAETAGIPFIHAAYGFAEVKRCDFRINSFEELIGILKGTNE